MPTVLQGLRTRRVGGLSLLIAAALAGASLASVPLAPTPAVDPVQIAAGQAIADRDCASCHATGREGDSPLDGAPRWRDLHDRYDVGDLGESLAEGIVAGHEAMPSRAYDPADIEALIAYLRSLETPAAAP